MADYVYFVSAWIDICDDDDEDDESGDSISHFPPLRRHVRDQDKIPEILDEYFEFFLGADWIERVNQSTIGYRVIRIDPGVCGLKYFRWFPLKRSTDLQKRKIKVKDFV